MGWFTRGIRAPDPIPPNANTPAESVPGTVGPPSAVAGDPSGVTIQGPVDTGWSPPAMPPVMPWSGWPADWFPPMWNTGGMLEPLTDVAWMCLDRNAGQLAAMPPYLVGAAPSLQADWLNNPQPEVYSCWDEFMRQYAWDYQLGEVFVLA